MSFFTTVVPVIMRQENYSLESIGLLQFVKLPWILKFLWAPLIDKKTNSLAQYKSWIITSEICYAIVILCVGFFNLQTDFNMIIILMLIAIFASATQDIATDALAILTLKKRERSMGNAIQSIGGFLGALIGSGLLLLIYNAFGWKALLMGLSGFVLLAILPLLKFNYKLRTKPRRKKITWQTVFGFFKQKGVKTHVLFLLLSTSGLTGIMSMLKPYMVDHGYDVGEIGLISGIIGTSAAALAACASGMLMKRKGLRMSLLFFSAFAILVGVFFVYINRLDFTTVHIIVGSCLLWACYGMINVAVYTSAMNWARSGMEGTDFTIQIVVSQFGSLVVAGLSGLIARKMNYEGLFIIEILLASLTLIYIFLRYKGAAINE